MDYHLKLEKLTVGYCGSPVVEEINALVKKGRILCLIGPNGSGKSTILKSIAKQLKTISGTAKIGESSIEYISPREFSQRVAAVLTERPKPELMTCGDVAAIGRYPYTGMLGILSPEDKEKVDEALRLVNAWELRDKSFNQISDGQLQRIMLARALCQEPEIIVLDEPTSFLDIRFAVEILDILRRLADEKNVTVIMSLHELSYAKRVSDIVMCVKEGRILHLDTPEAIFTKEIISSLYELSEENYNQLFGGL